MINLVTIWFEVMQYNYKRAISIADLVKTTWLSRYPRPMEIMYDQGSELFGHEFRKPLIEIEYWITSKSITLGNPMSNAILEHIHQVLGNLVRTCKFTQTYVDKDDPWSSILDETKFAIRLTKNRLKGYSPGQLVSGHDMILPIKHTANWELIRQRKQVKPN